MAKPQAAAPRRSIDPYTPEAKERHSIGHFEIDAMHGRQGGKVVQNKIKRKSRKMFLDSTLRILTLTEWLSGDPHPFRQPDRRLKNCRDFEIA